MNATHPPVSRKAVVSSSLCILVSAMASTSRADNPIVQTNYTADPAPMVYGDRLYVHTTHDEDVTVKDFFTMNEWRVYSTTDMVNWTDHGSPLSYKSFTWGTDNAWAGQCIPRNGKFYFYVPLNNNSGTKIGVAVGDSPIGPFKDALGKPLLTGGGYIDPTVFIDTDGQAYLYWGNPNLYYVTLNEDMTSYKGSVNKVNLTPEGFGKRTSPTAERPAAYEEGPWFYKRGSLYYMIYPADSTPEKLSYSTSSGPTGPWTFRGDIMPKQTGQGSSFTNHPGVVDYKGKSYFFYHNGALPGGGGYKRSVCVEEFTYGADGSIPSIKMTKEGPAPVAILNPFLQVEAETMAFSSGLKTETCTDTGGGINVSSISNGDTIKVGNVDFADGVTSFEARVSSSTSGAKIELHLDSQSGTLLGTCDVSGATSWTTKTCEVSGGSGKHDLFLKLVGGSGDLFKFNWWKFTGPRMPDGGDGGVGGAGGGTGGTGGGGGAGGSKTTDGSGTAGRGGSTAGGASGTTTGTGGAATGGRSTGVAGSGGQAAGGSTSSQGLSSGGAGSGGRSASASSGAAGSGSAGSSAGGASSSPSSSGGAKTTSSASGSSTDSANGSSSGCSCGLGSGRPSAGLAMILMIVGLALRGRRGARRT